MVNFIKFFQPWDNPSKTLKSTKITLEMFCLVKDQETLIYSLQNP